MPHSLPHSEAGDDRTSIVAAGAVGFGGRPFGQRDRPGSSRERAAVESWARLGTPEPPLAQGTQATVRGAAEETADLSPPQVTIRIRTAATIIVGQDLEYRLIIDNRSRAPAHHVVVRASAPTFATVGKATPEANETKQNGERHWQLGTLEAGASKEIVFTVKPTGDGEISCCAASLSSMANVFGPSWSRPTPSEPA